MYQKKIKESNEKKIFNYIYKKEEDLNAVDISNTLNISFPTVKNVLEKYLKDNIINKSLKIGGKSGRKAQNYSLNKNFCYSIGVVINMKKIHIILTNEKGINIKETCIKETFNIDTLTLRLFEELEEFIGSISKEIIPKIIGIGISIPGVLDTINKKIEIGIRLKLDFSIIESIEEKFKMKVFIENESNLVAIVEKFMGIGEKCEDFIVLTIQETIGIGIFNQENYYEGFHFKAGRVAHMTIDMNGEKCECGDSGCWGKYISDDILLQKFKNKFPLIKKYDDIFLSEYLESKQGNEIIENYIKYLARGIKNLIFFSNPEKLIISGKICKHNHIIKDKLLNCIYNDNIFLRGKETIQFSEFEQCPNSIGAAMLPIVDTLF